MIVSAPSFKKINRGRRLMKKLSFTDVLTCVVAQFRGLMLGVRVERRGKTRRAKIIIKLEVIMREVRCIATTWTCTKSFWFLRPTDELYPLEAIE